MQRGGVPFVAAALSLLFLLGASGGTGLAATGSLAPTAQLVPNDESGLDQFGASVALSADGTTALVGGPANSGSRGAAWVYTMTSNGWSEQAMLTPSDASTGSGQSVFGYAVAISSDGNTALIGGPGDNGEEGAVWVFTRSGSTWAQDGSKLTPSDPTNPGTMLEFGRALALSSDGETALVGGADDNGFVGAVWVFSRNGQTWTQQGPRITGTGASGASGFGSSVALSFDGNTALIGGPDDNNDTGAAWIFTRAAGDWTQQGSKLTGAGATTASRFGAAVALSSNGETALIGGSGDDTKFNPGGVWTFGLAGDIWTAEGGLLTAPVSGVDDFGFGAALALSGDATHALVTGRESTPGHVWAYHWTSGGWVLDGELTESDAATLPSFSGVALDSGGSVALVGGADDHQNDGQAGAVWTFSRSSDSWTEQGHALTESNANGQSGSGWSVSLSTDGNKVLVGGPTDNGPNGPTYGAAWVFTRAGSIWQQQGPKLVPSSAGEAGTSVALSGDGSTALIGTDGNTASVFSETGGVWSQQGPSLQPSDGVPESTFNTSKFGASGSLSADGNTALIGGPWDAEYGGAAWIFNRSGTTWTQDGGKLVGSGTTPAPGGSEFGLNVALSADGSTAIIGGSGALTWIFTRSGQNWTQQGTPIPAGGGEVAISADGNVVLIGTPGSSSTGGAAVYVRESGVWTQRATLSGSGAVAGSGVGTTVALSPDGSTAAISGPAGSPPEVWVFARSGPAWNAVDSGLTGSSSADKFGNGLALSGDGSTLAIGAPGDNSRSGATWIYPNTATLPGVPTGGSGGGSSGGSGGGGGGASGAVTTAAAPSVPPTTSFSPSPASVPKTTTRTNPPYAKLALLALHSLPHGAGKPSLVCTLRASRATSLVLTLRDKKGHTLATWHKHAKPGRNTFTLLLPRKARKPGHLTLKVAAAGNPTATVGGLMIKA